MTLDVTHAKVLAELDDPAYPVGSDEWNADHVLLMATGKVLGRGSPGTGAVEELVGVSVDAAGNFGVNSLKLGTATVLNILAAGYVQLNDLDGNQRLAVGSSIVADLTSYYRGGAHVFSNMANNPQLNISDAPFGVTSYGPIHVTDATASTNVTTGALTVAGGAGIAGGLNCDSLGVLGAAYIFGNIHLAQTGPTGAGIWYGSLTTGSDRWFVGSDTAVADMFRIYSVLAGINVIEYVANATVDNGSFSVRGSLHATHYIDAPTGMGAAFGYRFGGSKFMEEGSGYRSIFDPSANARINIGPPPGDPSTYYMATTHAFYNLAGTTEVVSINGTRLAVEQTTASTSTTTGALTVAGGVGVAGAVWAGTSYNLVSSKLVDESSNYRKFYDHDGHNRLVLGPSADKTNYMYADMYVFRDYADTANLASLTGLAWSIGSLNTALNVAIGDTTASTSTTTGALVVAGGVGVATDINAGGYISASIGAYATTGYRFGSIVFAREKATGSRVLHGNNGEERIYIGADGLNEETSANGYTWWIGDFTTEIATMDATDFTFNGTINASPPAASGLQGILVTQDQDSATYTSQDNNFNYINISNDTANVATAGFFSHGLRIDLGIGSGPAAVGGRYALKGVTVNNASDNDTSGDIVGVSGIAGATKKNGGTNTGAGAKGTLYGHECVGQAQSGATNYLVVSGGECDAIINTGGSAKYRWGWSIVGNGDLQGASQDGALQISSVTSAGRWQYGILFSNGNGQNPVTATGTLIGTDGSAVTVDKGVDFSAYTISTAAFKSTGFTVDGSGNITAGTYNGATLNNTAWTTATPTITSGTGTLTTVSSSCHYKQIGKTIVWNMTITITTNGTGATYLRSTNMPFTPAFNTPIAGNCPQTGLGVAGTFDASTTVITLFNAAGGYPTDGANARTVVIGGVVEV